MSKQTEKNKQKEGKRKNERETAKVRVRE